MFCQKFRWLLLGIAVCGVWIFFLKYVKWYNKELVAELSEAMPTSCWNMWNSYDIDDLETQLKIKDVNVLNVTTQGCSRMHVSNPDLVFVTMQKDGKIVDAKLSDLFSEHVLTERQVPRISHCIISAEVSELARCTPIMQSDIESCYWFARELSRFRSDNYDFVLIVMATVVAIQSLFYSIDNCLRKKDKEAATKDSLPVSYSVHPYLE